MNKDQKRFRQINIHESFARSKKTKTETPSMEDNLRQLLAAAAEKRLNESTKTDQQAQSSCIQSSSKDSAVAVAVASTNEETDVKETLPPPDEENWQQNSTELFSVSLENLHFSADVLPNSADIFDGVPEANTSEAAEISNSQKSDKSVEIDSFPDSFHSTELFVEDCDTDTSSYEDSPDDESEMDQFNRSPGCNIPLPPLEPLENHTILFSTNIRKGVAPRPYPTAYRDIWDVHYVRMPCSPMNKYPVEDLNGMKHIRSRWEVICHSLRRRIQSSEDLEKAIMQYNAQYRGKWNFTGLHTYFNVVLTTEERTEFFDNILPKMVELALNLPNICTQPIPLLKKDKDFYLTMSQKQVGCLLVNAFFCTFPRRNAFPRNDKLRWSHEYATYPHINFNKLFFGVKTKITTNTEKLNCLFNYFRRIVSSESTGVITFHRQCLTDLPNWMQSTKPIKTAVIKSKGFIETIGGGMLQVDFANKFVGGGVLGGGCVQEEIRFVICPELIVSRLFAESLENNEVLIITGAEQYNIHRGYSNTFKWEGDFQDTTPRDAWERRCTEIVAMDATHYRNSAEQFKIFRFEREVNKAYCGFYQDAPSANLAAVATGNWGCGAFNGNPHLKFLIQLIAASETRRDLLYITFGNNVLRNDLKNIYEFVIEKNLSVGDLWRILEDYSGSVSIRSSRMLPALYDFMRSFFADEPTADEFDAEDDATTQPMNSDDYAMIRLCEDVEKQYTKTESDELG